MKYHGTVNEGGVQHAQGVIFDVPDMAFQGTGTTTLRFYLRTSHLEPAPPGGFEIGIGFTLHEDGLFKIVRPEAETAIPLEVP